MNASKLRRLALSPAVAMTGSLGLVAVAGYAFLSLAGYLPDSRDKAAMASFYVVVNTVGQGIFIGLEQEVSRSLSHTIATDGDVGPVVRRAFRQTAGLLAACLLLIAAISPVLVNGPLHGDWPLIGAVLFGTCTAAASYCARGLLGGSRQFGGYAVTLIVEGGTRLVPCVAIAAMGVGSVLAYSYVYACGLLFAAAVGFRKLRPLLAQARESRSSVPPRGRWWSASLLFLVGAGLLTQLVANLPALAASARLSHATTTAAAFVQAASLARIPVLLTGPVTALLLPRLTSAAATGAVREVRTTVLAGVAAMVGLGAGTAVGLAALGPWVLGTFFNAHGISAWSLAVMGVGTGGIMAVSVLQPALVGLGRQRWAPIAWGVGAAAMTVVVAWPTAPVRAAVAGSVLGPAIVAVAMSLGVARGVARAAEGGRATLPAPQTVSS